MPEVLIRLERPALLTPELRAWLADRMDGGRAILARERTNGSDRGALLLRVEMGAHPPGTHPPDSDDEVQDEVGDLMTDLRLLGLRPALVSEQLA
jgi:hypothetical protein